MIESTEMDQVNDFNIWARRWFYYLGEGDSNHLWHTNEIKMKTLLIIKKPV